jgi:predicted phosphodiesterase
VSNPVNGASYDFTWDFDFDPSPPSVDDLLALTPKPAHRPRRILLLSDVHGNWHALAAVIKAAAGRYDSIVFLGDVVGYGPRPLECVEYLLRAVPAARWRAGNHDLGVFGYMDGIGWSGNAAFTLTAHRWMLDGDRALQADFRRLVTPRKGGPLLRSYGRCQQVLTHANLENDMETYLFPRGLFAGTGNNLLRLRHYVSPPAPCAWLLVGHTHVPCLFRLPAKDTSTEDIAVMSIPYGQAIPVDDGHYLINPGSVGQPRDGNRDAAYALLDVQELTVEFGRVRYDDVAVAQEMNAAYEPERARSLIQLLQNAGTAKTHLELTPVYTVESWGLKANPVFGGRAGELPSG